VRAGSCSKASAVVVLRGACVTLGVVLDMGGAMRRSVSLPRRARDPARRRRGPDPDPEPGDGHDAGGARDADRQRRLVELFEAHHTAVLGYVSRRSATRELAADAFSDVFLVAWRRLDDVPAGDGARLWLLAVARRSLANARRATRRQASLTERLAASLPRSGFVVPPPDAPDGRLRAALGRLGPDDAELLRLVGWEGLTPTQAASVIGVSPALARVRLHRARARLRALLAAADHSEPQRSAPSGHSQQRRAPVRLVGEEAT
jgi:RNA polymerase sigma factor (sigma-70 family)